MATRATAAAAAATLANLGATMANTNNAAAKPARRKLQRPAPLNDVMQPTTVRTPIPVLTGVPVVAPPTSDSLSTPTHFVNANTSLPSPGVDLVHFLSESPGVFSPSYLSMFSNLAGRPSLMPNAAIMSHQLSNAMSSAKPLAAAQRNPAKRGASVASAPGSASASDGGTNNGAPARKKNAPFRVDFAQASSQSKPSSMPKAPQLTHDAEIQDQLLDGLKHRQEHAANFGPDASVAKLQALAAVAAESHASEVRQTKRSAKQSSSALSGASKGGKQPQSSPLTKPAGKKQLT